MFKQEVKKLQEQIKEALYKLSEKQISLHSFHYEEDVCCGQQFECDNKKLLKILELYEDELQLKGIIDSNSDPKISHLIKKLIKKEEQVLKKREAETDNIHKEINKLEAELSELFLKNGFRTAVLSLKNSNYKENKLLLEIIKNLDSVHCITVKSQKIRFLFNDKDIIKKIDSEWKNKSKTDTSITKKLNYIDPIFSMCMEY